jgi:outer membrane receptor protein involved in Fe transport
VSVVSATALAMAIGSPLFSGARAATPSSAEEAGLSEIIVTAEKFQSTVQATPISISAMSGDQMMAAGINSIQDLALTVPGLSTRYAGPGLTEYEARGIASNGGAAPTVGFYLDEIPLSPPALSQSGKVVIDPNLYDTNRVEVLRGPQGTLYGSSSMGGTVRVITNQPKLNTFEGAAMGMVSDTEGGGWNYSANAMFNFPLGDKLALRVVATESDRSGWIDRTVISPFPVTLGYRQFGSPPPNYVPADVALLTAPVVANHSNVNDARLTGIRGALLWQPTDALSFTVFGMSQHFRMGGYDLLDSPPNTLQHFEAFDFAEGVHDDISIYALTIHWDLGFADLTSATSYFDRLGWQTQDASVSIYWTNNGATPFVPVPYDEQDPSRQTTQELRLTSKGNGNLNWTVGGFYSNLHSVWIEQSHNVNNPTVPNGVYFDSYNPYRVRQWAIFGDGSYKLSDHWTLAAGLRWYRYSSEQHEFSWGFDGPFPVPPPAPTLTTSNDRGFNPRVNLSYIPNKDLTVYATAAKGFRPGGANQIIPPPNEPPFCSPPGVLQFHPDTVWNYELGEKARLANGRLAINGAVYYIRWSNVQQVFTLNCGYQYYNNAGDGRTYGPELEIDARLTDEWTVYLSGAWTSAEITHPTPNYVLYLETVATQTGTGWGPCRPGNGTCTAPILNVPRATASGSLVYATTLQGDYRVSGRISGSYVGSQTDVAYYYGISVPSYAIGNLRGSLGRGRWSVDLFVDNFTNKVARMSANNTSFQFNIPQLIRYSTNQPRTYGTQFEYRF